MHMSKQDNIRKRTILTMKTFQFQKISNQRVKIGENYCFLGVYLGIKNEDLTLSSMKQSTSTDRNNIFFLYKKKNMDN